MNFSKTAKKLLIITTALFSVPFFALAVNDVSINNNTNFQLNTFDTAASTTIIASAGGLVTNLDVQSNYIDITIDSSSTITFTTTVGGQFLKIIQQSGLSNFTVTPTCPTNTVTLTGTLGATVVLRLEVLTTNGCTPPPPPPPSGGGGGGGFIYPTILTLTPTSTPTTTLPVISPVVAEPCSPYLNTFMRYGSYNDPAEVRKLQTFLHDYEGETGLAITGIFDLATLSAVKRFQAKYANDVLIPWGIYTPTGYVYRTTIYKINALYCAKVKGCGAYLTKYIRLGAVNDVNEVIKLQNFLRSYEGETGLAVTGIYDLATYNAVKRFQAKYINDILVPWGVYSPTGYVFRTTIFKINEIYCTGEVVLPAQNPVIPPVVSQGSFVFNNNLKLGSVGDDVRALQQFLNTHSFQVSVSGVGSPGNEGTYFGLKTRAALARFQAANGISPAVGYFGPITRTLVNRIISGSLTPSPSLPVSPVTFTRNLIPGSVGEDVRKLQQFLNNNGFIVAVSGAGSPGNESTYFGPATKAALSKFQAANGISPATGYFGPITRAFINAQ